MKKLNRVLLAFALLMGSSVSAGRAVAATPPATVAAHAPAFWAFAPTPPMGWNSYDALGTSATEDETLANAQYMKDHLLAHGWMYIVIDARWYDAVSSFSDRDLNKQRGGVKLAADEFGRLFPAPSRFPSAVDGNGFRPLADKIHTMGLKFGLHMMRGIPREAVNAKAPIEGTSFTAADASDAQSVCGWCPDMYGVKDNQAGQAWYDALFRLCASWGLDFVKVDDLSNPYHTREIEMIRTAIDRCGRPIVFSTSAGPIDMRWADHIKTHANQWRISGDFWDRWKDLDNQFDLFAKWCGVSGPGHFPDGDMIPFGHIGIKCTIAGKDRQTRLTHHEQLTLMSLWSLNSSPLMLGNYLPDTDEWTLSLLTNDEVLAIDQDALGRAAKRLPMSGGLEVWVKPLQDGSSAVGLFNRSGAEASVDLDLASAGFTGGQLLRDVWQRKDLGRFDGHYRAGLPSHGVILLHVMPAAATR